MDKYIYSVYNYQKTGYKYSENRLHHEWNFGSFLDNAVNCSGDEVRLDVSGAPDPVAVPVSGHLLFPPEGGERLINN